MYRHNENPKAIYLKDYTEPKFWVGHVDLLIEIFDGYTYVTSSALYIRNCASEHFLELDGENLELLSVQVEGHEYEDFERDSHSLKINLQGRERALVKIKTKIKPEENTSLEGIYKSDGVYCSQCEAEGFRHITYFQDRPDVMTEYTVRIEADKTKNPILLCNGNPIEHGDLEDGRHFVTWHDPFKKPCYLFAVVAGDLAFIKDSFTTMSGRVVDLRIYVEHGNEDQIDFAMSCLKSCMEWDEQAFGREYDLERFNIVAVHMFNFGAMENKSLNIFNSALLFANPELATDIDFYLVDAVVGHEYFHNWSGNRVTCRDWFQISLKEGFTVFREQAYCADRYSPATQRIDDVANLRQRQFPEDSGPMAHPIRPDSYIEINNFYTMTVYEKGSEVIRMMSLLLGKEKFRKGCDLYFDRHDGEAATCDDFVKAMEDASGIDLSQFKLWYSQAGTPIIDAHGSYDPETKTYSLKLKQTIPDTPGQKNKKPMHMPIAFGLIGENGEDLIGTEILELKEKEQSFEFANIAPGATPSILRQFSAPVKLRTNLSNEQLAFLMVHETDGFNKWEAGQQYALNVLMPLIDKSEMGKSITTPKEFIKVMSDLLDTYDPVNTDKGLLARSLMLPGFDYLAELRDVIDPDAIFNTRKKVMHDLSVALKDKFQKIYDDTHKIGTFSPDAQSMAQRSLKNAVLSYLMADQKNPAVELAMFQYKSADNMNDRIAALRELCSHDTQEVKDILDDFLKHYQKHELVVNKWFSAQVSAPRENAAAYVKSLLAHEKFSLKKPNTVRAVLGGFAMHNPIGFHDLSGAGYDLLADMIIQLNRINPQIAAGLTRPLQRWKRYGAARQEKMKAALTKVINTEKLSKEVYELVSKSLSD